jgi:hypothetical protein
MLLGRPADAPDTPYSVPLIASCRAASCRFSHLALIRHRACVEFRQGQSSHIETGIPRTAKSAELAKLAKLAKENG